MRLQSYHYECSGASNLSCVLINGSGFFSGLHRSSNPLYKRLPTDTDLNRPMLAETPSPFGPFTDATRSAYIFSVIPDKIRIWQSPWFCLACCVTVVRCIIFPVFVQRAYHSIFFRIRYAQILVFPHWRM